MSTDDYRSIAIIAAHPDDDVLGAGGTIARYTSNGSEVYPCFLTHGCEREGGEEESIALRQMAATDSCTILGTQPPLFFNLPDQRLDSLPLIEIIKKVEMFLRETSPSLVFIHHAGDLNLDHRIAHKASLTAMRPLTDSVVKKILSFEVPSSTEWNIPLHSQAFVPNTFFDITETFEKKIEALEAYTMEVRDFPHPRSRESLKATSTYWGRYCGFQRAEAFVLVRELYD